MSIYESSYDTASLQVINMPYYLTLSVDKEIVDLYDGVTFSGRLTQEHPASTAPIPVANAIIRIARHIVAEAGENWLYYGITTTTDAQGYFQIEYGLPQSAEYEFRAEYQSPEGLIVSDSVFLEVEQTLGTVIDAELADESIYLGDSFTVSGRVFDSNGNPVPGGLYVRVNVVGRSQLFTVYLDAQGYYSCTVTTTEAGITAPGNYQIKVTFPGGSV
jgi:hypothetical protein